MLLSSTFILFVVGFFFLIQGANYLVSGARSVAKLFNASPWFVGIVVVGIGTSIPELAISVASVFNNNEVGLATLVGSNIFNTLFILGFSAVLSPLVLKRVWVRRDLVLNIGAIVCATIVIFLPVVGDPAWLGVTRLEAGILAVLFLCWIAYMLKRHETLTGSTDYSVFSVFTSFLLIVVGILGVFLGGQWVVHGAEAIALLHGVSPALVALTVVAVGTSLPELAVAIVALLKKQKGIAVGSIIGSNIFDFLGIIGITALLRPIPTTLSIGFDMLAVFISASILFVMMFVVGKRYTIGRAEGLFLILCYALYLVFIFSRG